MSSQCRRPNTSCIKPERWITFTHTCFYTVQTVFYITQTYPLQETFCIFRFSKSLFPHGDLKNVPTRSITWHTMIYSMINPRHTHLRWYPDEQEPLLLLVCSVVDDLASREAGVAIEHLDWLRVSLHAPMIDGRVRNQGDGVNRDPPPEQHFIRRGVSLDFTLHLHVKDLQRPRRCGTHTPPLTSHTQHWISVTLWLLSWPKTVIYLMHLLINIPIKCIKMQVIQRDRANDYILMKDYEDKHLFWISCTDESFTFTPEMWITEVNMDFMLTLKVIFPHTEYHSWK